MPLQQEIHPAWHQERDLACHLEEQVPGPTLQLGVKDNYLICLSLPDFCNLEEGSRKRYSVTAPSWLGQGIRGSHHQVVSLTKPEGELMVHV